MASPPQRSYTPLQTGMALSPNKRQRLSPGPSPLGTNHDGSFQSYQQSPAGTSPVNTSYPSNGYNHNPVHSFNQPQPHLQLPPIDTGSRPSLGNMGPPERPRAEKATDINDLSDLVTAAGVDLRAEENYMAATYRNKHQDSSFSTSFGTSSSSTVSPGNSFQQWSQGSYGSYPPFQPSGNLSQPPVTEASVEDELKAKHKRAARQMAESREAHLRNPFLQTNELRYKLDRIGNDYQVRLAQRGIRDQFPLAPQYVRGTSMVGSDGIGLVTVKGATTLDYDAPLVDLLTLLSLATNQRVRGLMEDAYAIARSRQHGTHGIVPPEWADIAQGNGVPQDTTAQFQSITHTAWDHIPDTAVSPTTISTPKRNPTDATARLPTPPTEPEAPLLSTVAYASPLPAFLKSIATTDREAEKKRLERRKRRDKARQSSVVDEVASPNTAGASPATPSATTGAAKMTKKELAKQKGAQQTEDYMHRQANQTAALALGGGSKRYSWMTSGAATAAPTLGAGVGLGRGNATVSRTNSASTILPQEDAGLKSKEYWKKFGEFREDGPKGKGVQIRDWITVLEREGMERKTLARCYAKLSSKEDQR